MVVPGLSSVPWYVGVSSAWAGATVVPTVAPAAARVPASPHAAAASQWATPFRVRDRPPEGPWAMGHCLHLLFAEGITVSVRRAREWRRPCGSSLPRSGPLETSLSPVSDKVASTPGSTGYPVAA